MSARGHTVTAEFQAVLRICAKLTHFVNNQLLEWEIKQTFMNMLVFFFLNTASGFVPGNCFNQVPRCDRNRKNYLSKKSLSLMTPKGCWINRPTGRGARKNHGPEIQLQFHGEEFQV